ncbi:MAG: ABC transporter ATP-binding protein, partial [Actinomycetota bacterium]|nr:ABC transporter ATP-binding protein [Actinomycetota bacterium]
MSPLLDVRNLRVHFPTSDGVVKAVDGLSLQLDRGRRLGIVGESGSGKSVTSLSIMGLHQPGTARISGEIWLGGQELVSADPEQVRKLRGRSMAMIFQDPLSALHPYYPVGRQIVEAYRLHHDASLQAARSRAVELLDRVGIPQARSRVDDYPHQFSGGMRQRVMIAMALSCNPKLLIADEPTTALDVTIQAQILDLMRTLRMERDTGVILVTHSMGVVAGMADRIQVMYAGHIVETASTEEIFANPRHPYTVGLLKSIPRLDATRKEKLEPIRGLPPDLIDLPDMCPFVPRCNYAREKCEQKNPPLLEVNPGHWSACWFWEEVSKESDQDLVALRHGHPPPSSIEDFSLETVIPGAHGVADPNNPLVPGT